MSRMRRKRNQIVINFTLQRLIEPGLDVSKVRGRDGSGQRAGGVRAVAGKQARVAGAPQVAGVARYLLPSRTAQCVVRMCNRSWSQRDLNRALCWTHLCQWLAGERPPLSAMKAIVAVTRKGGAP